LFAAILKKLTISKSTGTKPATAPSTALPQQPCPRCSKPIARNASFCSHCGAALEMWKVQRAQVQATSSAPKGKPRPVINASLCVGCGSCVEVCPESGTLELAGHKAILAHPDRCTGHARCKDVCPTQAISLSFGGVLQTLKVPQMNERFETNVPGLYIVGELGGMGLIKTAINEGKLVIDHLRRSLEQRPKDQTADRYNVAIIGAGPAGLSASLTAQQYGLRYLTLEQGEVASTIRQYPRQKFLMAEPIDIPLYGSLYVGDGTKESLLEVWESIVKNTGVQIKTNERLEGAQRNGTGFWVTSSKNRYHAQFIVLAMGRRGTPRKLDVPGEDLAKVAYRLIEADSYEGKQVLVVGGGDSAIEAALALSRENRNRVTLCHRRDTFQRVRERNRQFLETAEKEGRVRILRNSHVTAIAGDTVTVDTGGKSETFRNDYVFVLIGGESPEEFLRKLGIQIVEKVVTETLPTF
jgi:putative YpdA family bacillithiol system oxidoreductase